MTWYLVVNKTNGDAVSEASDPSSDPATALPNVDRTKYDLFSVGANRVDWSVKLWNPTTRQLFDRPVPILIDRLDDIQARFLADPDFSAVWNALSAARKTQLKTGIMRVLAQIVGTKRWRQESEPVEVD